MCVCGDIGSTQIVLTPGWCACDPDPDRINLASRVWFFPLLPQGQSGDMMYIRIIADRHKNGVVPKLDNLNREKSATFTRLSDDTRGAFFFHLRQVFCPHHQIFYGAIASALCPNEV